MRNSSVLFDARQHAAFFFVLFILLLSPFRAARYDRRMTSKAPFLFKACLKAHDGFLRTEHGRVVFYRVGTAVFVALLHDEWSIVGPVSRRCRFGVLLAMERLCRKRGLVETDLALCRVERCFVVRPVFFLSLSFWYDPFFSVRRDVRFVSQTASKTKAIKKRWISKTKAHRTMRICFLFVVLQHAFGPRLQVVVIAQRHVSFGTDRHASLLVKVGVCLVCVVEASRMLTLGAQQLDLGAVRHHEVVVQERVAVAVCVKARDDEVLLAVVPRVEDKLVQVGTVEKLRFVDRYETGLCKLFGHHDVFHQHLCHHGVEFISGVGHGERHIASGDGARRFASLLCLNVLAYHVVDVVDHQRLADGRLAVHALLYLARLAAKHGPGDEDKLGEVGNRLDRSRATPQGVCTRGSARICGMHADDRGCHWKMRYDVLVTKHSKKGESRE